MRRHAVMADADDSVEYPPIQIPVMQFVFDTPIAPAGQTINQCGRVLYNEYHVENPQNGSQCAWWDNVPSTNAT